MVVALRRALSRSLVPPRRRLVVALTGAGLVAGAFAAPAAGAIGPGAPGGGSFPAQDSAPSAQTARVCERPTEPGLMTCFAMRGGPAKEGRVAPSGLPSGYGPSALRGAYKIATLAQQAGRGQTVAIVDAYNDPTAESDLATYRAMYHLPPCTTANGCFTKVNQRGLHRDYPPSDPQWSGEISLDLDMVSAVCPHCKILLVEADDAYADSLGKAVNTAVRLGAKFVSNSFGGNEFSDQTLLDDAYWHHPGVVITASTGDYGYGVSYPAASPHVTAVGGTSLYHASTSRGWRETAWSGAGSGCSSYEVRPSYQVSTASACPQRAVADVAAVADPYTGVAVYQTYGGYGWTVYGGTSASAPIVAGIYALAGAPAVGTTPASYPYEHANHLFDVTTGSNGSCAVRFWCVARTGWDGPTGLGTPNGAKAFKGTRWFGQSDTGMGPLDSAPATAVTSKGDLFAFWKGANGEFMQSRWTGSAWSKPADKGLGTLAAPPAVAADRTGHLYAYWMGADSTLHRSVWSGTAWSRPTRLASASMASAPAVAVKGDGSQYVYWKGSDDRLWEAQRADGRWFGPKRLAVGVSSAPTAAVDPAGHRFVFWRGSDDKLKQISWAGTWSGVSNLNMGLLGSEPAAAIGKDGQRYVFWQGTDNTLKQAYWNGRNWVGPLAVGMHDIASQPAVAIDPANKLHVVWRGSGDDLIATSRTAWP